jgi:dihydrolipoamide dehydrogenase
MEDLVIIGAGPAGYVAAIRAAQLGLNTGIVEKLPTFGGTCLNVGCIPSKALLQSSEHYAFISNHAKEHGISVKDQAIDFKQMMRRKDEAVESLVKGVAGLLKRNKVKTFQGTARFISPHAIEVDGKTIEAKSFLLATGSEPIALPFLPFDEKQVLSSTGALVLSQIPKKMIVIGAGVIGVELASVYNRIGTEVIVIEMLDRICPAMDNQIGKMLQQVLTKQGLVFHLGAKVADAKIGKKDISLKVELEGKAKDFKADVVLVAIGRRPYTEGLGLEKAGVKKTERGFVSVDADFRTNVPHILAVGDIVDGPMLAHRASEEGIAAVESLAGVASHINYMSIPNVIYTHPEVAAVGLTEEEGKEMGLELIKGTYLFKGNPRARCAGDVDGMVKVIGDKISGRLLGMHIIGSHASEMIGEGVLAIEKRMTIEQLGNASHAHPTLSEAIKEAALNALGRAIHL